MEPVNKNWTAIPAPDSNDKLPRDISAIAECPPFADLTEEEAKHTKRLWSVNENGKDTYKTGLAFIGGKNPTAEQLTSYASGLFGEGYKFICRFGEPERKDSPYPLYLYAPPASVPTKFSECGDGFDSFYGKAQIKEPLGEAAGRYLESKFVTSDSNTGCTLPSKIESKRVYWLNTILLTPVIDEIGDDLKNNKVPPDMTQKRAGEIKKILEDIREDRDPGWNSKLSKKRDAKGQGLQIFQAIATVILIAIFGEPTVEKIIAKIKGRVKTTDFGEIIRKRIVTDPRYDVAGRDAEARAAWKMTNTIDYRHIIIDAPTGEGKEAIVEKMIIMKERGELVVPAGFRNAPVVKINAAEFQANTMFRGNVADKVAEIAARARKGPVIYYISEIDLIFLSGGSSSGDSEAVGKLLLDLVEDPVIRNNLILVGTTSRGQQMLNRYPDLQRRFNWPKIHSFSLSEIVDIIDGGWTKIQYEQRYGVKIPRETVEAATRLAEKYYIPSREIPMPRFDAVKKTVEDASKIASENSIKTVTVQHVIAATEVRCNQSLNPADVDRVLKQPIESFDPLIQTHPILEKPAAIQHGISQPESQTDVHTIEVGLRSPEGEVLMPARMSDRPLLAAELINVFRLRLNPKSDPNAMTKREIIDASATLLQRKYNTDQVTPEARQQATQIAGHVEAYKKAHPGSNSNITRQDVRAALSELAQTKPELINEIVYNWMTRTLTGSIVTQTVRSQVRAIDAANDLFSAITNQMQSGREGRSLTEPELSEAKLLADFIIAHKKSHPGADSQRLTAQDLFVAIRNYYDKFSPPTAPISINASLVTPTDPLEQSSWNDGPEVVIEDKCTPPPKAKPPEAAPSAEALNLHSILLKVEPYNGLEGERQKEILNLVKQYLTESPDFRTEYLVGDMLKPEGVLWIMEKHNLIGEKPVKGAKPDKNDKEKNKVEEKGKRSELKGKL